MPAVTDHPCFVQPQNTNGYIWRYMDFTKFVALLESSSIFFSRADLFEDIFEGSLPKGNLINQALIYREIPEDQRLNAIQQMSEFRRRVRTSTFINCWHMNQHESAAMWKLYAKTNEAIAIRSTYKRLSQSLSDTCHLGLVHYIDYENYTIPENNSFWPFMFKRFSFAHEHEVRAVIQDLGKNPNGTNSYESFGRSMPVNLNNLIDNIYVAPNVPQWFFDLVQNVVYRYQLDLIVNQSNLSEQPIF